MADLIGDVLIVALGALIMVVVLAATAPKDDEKE